MKKTMILSLVLSLLLSTWALAVPVQQVQAASVSEGFETWEMLQEGFGNGSHMPVFHAGGKLNVDGLLEDWDGEGHSALALPAAPEQVRINGWGGEEDLSMQARFAYDEENFYFSATVTDNIHLALANESMWSGDSIQLAFGKNQIYGPEYGFALVNGEAQVWRWVDGRAVLDKSAVSFRASRAGSETIYEASIPWRAIFEQAQDLDQPLPFSILVNDNDGGGRRGWIEWNESIGKTKDVNTMGMLYLVPLHDNWSFWLDTKPEIKPGETVPYTLTAVNYSQEMRALTFRSEQLGLERQVNVPAGTAVHLNSAYTVAVNGELTLRIDAEEEGQGIIRSLAIPVSAVGISELNAGFDDLEGRLPLLEGLLQQAQLQGLATDYEQVNYTTLLDFIGYGREDVAQGRLSRANYVLNELEVLFSEAVDSLQSGLAGDREPWAVPRYITGSLDITDYTFTGTTKIRSTQEVEENRPVFFNGYGHFDQVRRDMSKFQDYGANIVQVETGPSRVLNRKEGYIPSFASGKMGGVSGEYYVDDTVSRTGGKSLKMVNRTPKAPNVYLRVWQNVSLKANTTYIFRAWVKAEELQGQNAWFPGGPSWQLRTKFPAGTYDWTEITAEYTTGSSAVTAEMMFLLESTGTIWIDDVEVTEAGSSVNLVKNGGFEEFPNAIVVPDKDYLILTDRLQQDVISTLQAGEAYDVAVNVLLSPHYFPAWVLDQFPELRNTANKGFLKYDIYHPKAKEVVETYLRAVIPLIKDYRSLHSITLSNEPIYYANLNPVYLPKWQQYIRDVYEGDINELNRIYGSAYASFEDVPMPSALGSNPHSYDYMTFNSRMFSEWHQWMADIIHEIAPDVPVHVKIMTDLASGLERGTEIEQFSALSQINGNDAYNLLDNRPGSFQHEAIVYDMQRSFNKAPVFNSEHHFIQDGDTNYSPDQAIHATALFWQGAIHGRSASTAWVWERTYDASSPFEGSLLHRPDVVAAIGRTNLDLNRLAYEVKALQDTPAQAAILYSAPSALYNSNYFPALRNSYEALSYSGQSIRFVSEGQVAQGELSRYRLLVIPAATHVTEEVLEGIVSFVEQGGKVLMINSQSLGKDEHNEAHSSIRQQIVVDQALVLDGGATALQIREAALPLLEQESMTAVMLRTPSNGEPVYGVEWRSAYLNGKLLINAVNYTSQPHTVSLEVHGEPLSGLVLERISGQLVNPSSLELQPYTPYLLEIVPSSGGSAEATLSAGAEEAAPGSRVPYTIGVKQVQNPFTAMDVIVHYDPEVLEFETATEGDTAILAETAVQSVNSAYTVASAVKAEEGQIRLLLYTGGNEHALSGTEELIRLYAAVKETAPLGATASLSLSDLKLSFEGMRTTVDTTGASVLLTVAETQPPVDKSALLAAIASARSQLQGASVGTTPGQYPSHAYAELEAAIEAAEEASLSAQLGQSEIDAAKAALDEARQQFAASVIPYPPADKTELNARITAVQAVYDKAKTGDKIGQYPSAAKSALQTALALAKLIQADTDASQGTVDAAAADLQTAYETFTFSIITLTGKAKAVSIDDLTLLAKYYGIDSSHPDWSKVAVADLEERGEITIEVLAAVARMILNDWALQQ